MSLVTLLSKLDHTLRPALGALPATLFTRLYSSTRPWFSKVAAQDDVSVVSIPDQVSISFKHLTFRSYLGNAAGMYKQAEGYERAYAQGAGFYLCGTTTSLPRKGIPNMVFYIHLFHILKHMLHRIGLVCLMMVIEKLLRKLQVLRGLHISQLVPVLPWIPECPLNKR